MPAIFSAIFSKVGEILLLLAVVVVLAGFSYAMYEKAGKAEDDVSVAKANTHTAEHDRDTAIAAAASNAAVTAQVSRADAAQLEEVKANAAAHEQTAVALAVAKAEVNHAPHTSTCVSSPSVSVALDRLRDAHAARAALNGGGASDTAASGPVAAGVP